MPVSEFEKIVHLLHQLRDERGATFEDFRAFVSANFPNIQPTRTIHVAGTNGKGSVCAMLESIYRTAGYKIGLFTSPHLLDIRERVQIDRNYIPREKFCQFFSIISDRASAASVRLSMFEYITLIALLYFKEASVDIAILECGIGGRLDCTNIIEYPVACVVTSVSLDHEDLLGGTIAAITREKAGIIKSNTRVFIGFLPGIAEAVIGDICATKHARSYRTSRTQKTNLVGDFQEKNAGLAYTLVDTLSDTLPVSKEDIEYGLVHTFWPARNQQVELRSGNIVLFDGGHNSEAADAQREYVRKNFDATNSCLIFGSTKPKHAEHCLDVYQPHFSEILLCDIPGAPKKLENAFLQGLAKKYPAKCRITKMDEVVDILSRSTDKRFFITGSLYLIGEIAHALITAGQLDRECFLYADETVRPGPAGYGVS